MRFAELSAVTVDGLGTLLELESPVGRLQGALAARGAEREHAAVAEAFAAEVEHYRPRSHLAGDEASLARLREECMRVFLERLGVGLEPARFVPDFIDALVFQPLPGVAEGLARIRAEGVAIAVVSNWDCSLPDTLARVGLFDRVDAVVTSADVGLPKPHPDVFLRALSLLDAEPERAIHVGDELDDEVGARAAGMGFAPAPLGAVVASLE